MEDPSRKNEMISREYQVELFEIAKEKNIILYLPTGSGKTYIATLLIKHFAHVDKDRIFKSIGEGGVRSFFLVNTVPLVQQQAKQIETHTPLTVGRFTGSMNVDVWDDDAWRDSIDEKQVLVMTCQIFLDLIEKNRISLENVNLMIFDECHRAVKDHPMRRVMAHFENTSVNKQPRVLGLTATLLNGNAKLNNVMTEIKELEITFHAQVQTSLFEDVVKAYSTNPNESKVTYEDNGCDHICYKYCNEVATNLKSIVQLVKIDENVEPPLEIKPKNSYQIGSNHDKNSKRMINMINEIQADMSSLGIFGGSLAALAHLVSVQQMLPNVQEESCRIIYQAVSNDLVSMRKYIGDTIEESGMSDVEKLINFSSDKVRKLFAVLKKVKASDSAIVFVQKRFSAKILYYLLSRASKVDSKLSQIKCNYIVGFNTANPFKDTRENYFQVKQNEKVMNLFKQGELNVLFASNVVEEGVDIPKCNYVIMFDTVLDYRSYVQSKGRARDKDSHFIIMVARNNQSFDNKYTSYQLTEQALKDNLYGGKSRLRAAPTEEEIDEKLYNKIPGLEPYCPLGLKGPVITAVSAIPTANRYFASLKADRFTKVNHFWFIQNEKNKFRCCLQLPMEAKNPILVKGTLQNNIDNAKRSAALEACKILHKSGDLSSKHLLPVEVDVIKISCNFTPNFDRNENFEELVQGKPVKIGTNKNKRLYDKKWADVLKGCKPIPTEKMYLHLIELTPMSDPLLENHQHRVINDLYNRPNNFAILMSKKLPRLAPFPLYLSTGEFECRIQDGEEIKLNEENLDKISRFHFTIFDNVLKIAKKFMTKDITNTQNSYLITAVLKDGSKVRVDWNVINECKSAFPSPDNIPSKNERINIQVTDDNYFGKVISPWYRPGNYYIVTKICSDMSEETQFASENITYAQYYKNKYNLELFSKGQPLLEVWALSSRINSIKPRASSKQLKRKHNDVDGECDIFLLPELCTLYPFPGKYWLKCQLLPSILHRVSQLCLAEELRRSIAMQTGVGTTEHSSHLLKLEEDVSLRKSKVPDQCLALNHFTSNQNQPQSNKSNVWDEEEPVDIERSMETVTVNDIVYHTKFVKKPFIKTMTDSGNVSISDLESPRRTYGLKMVNPPPLSIFKTNNQGPQQVEVLQALTVAGANDILSCERFETLGDSFLKFVVSLALFQTQDMSEGHLTAIKGVIVGNKNLYFCGKKKNLGPMLGVDVFSPVQDWVAPGFHLPERVQNVVRRANIDINCIKNVVIPDAERKCGLWTPTTNELFKQALMNYNADDKSPTQNCSLTNTIAMTDKNVSDALEALLGVYLKTSGILGALNVMNWFGVTDPKLSTPQVLTSKPTSVKRGTGDPNNHLQHPEVLETILNYKFKDRNFLLQALTHPSYTRNNITKCYQNLEFLGDAIIDFLITIYIFEKCSKLTPGDLTDLRSALVNNITLACISVRNHFHKFLLYHSSKLNECIGRFTYYQEKKNHVVDKDVLFLVEENEVNIAEAIDVPKALGDCFESLVAAVYLDSGKNLNVTWKIVYNLMKTEIEKFSKDIPKNHVRMLHESKSSPNFKSVIEKDGVVLVEVEILHNRELLKFNGFGDNKQGAKRAAAKHALRYLKSKLNSSK